MWLPIKPNPEGNEESRRNAFTCLIGSLQYLTIATCPNIAFAVNWLSTYTANPILSSPNSCKMHPQVFSRYKRSQNYSTYQKTQPTQSDMELLHGFTNAIYPNNTNY